MSKHMKHDYELSLIHDVLKDKGNSVADIYGYVSHEFGDPIFKLTRIIMKNGKTFDVEGEHDLPYISDDDELNLPEEEAEE